MASKKDDFEFLNSEIWIKYTQQRYVPLEDIKYRLNQRDSLRDDWIKLRGTIQIHRKMGAVPFFINSIDKKFWYFPSDSINQKILQINDIGQTLYDKIEHHASFKEEFLTNASVEEAVTSAIYEGVNSTRAQARAFIALNKKPDNKDQQMLVNNYNGMKWIKENATFPITHELIQKIHHMATENTLESDDKNFCGRYRNDKVYIGSHEGIPHNKIENALQEIMELTTNHSRFIHDLIKGILLHYFIAYIHPFFDGNGRTARTLFYFMAIKNNLKFLELLSISAGLKDHGKRYERSFDLVMNHDLDMTFFIDYCLDSLLKALNEVEKKVHYLIHLSKIMQNEGFNSKQISLIQKMALNKHKSISIEEYAASIEKSREMARLELRGLKEKEYLNGNETGKKYLYTVNSKIHKK